jgi:uncharacterized protein
MFELRSDSTRSGAVGLQWGVKIPMRDGVQLHGTLYSARQSGEPKPVIVTLTPYIGQLWHDFGVYFASHGYPFLAVDARGRGNSRGEFVPFVHEARDGHDIVEWVARQPYCNGKVAMWGGSYAAYDQWATARELPPHLATIVPVAPAYMGVDFPGRSNILPTYLMQWLTLVSGRTLQDKLFFNSERYWGARFREWFESGSSFAKLDAFLGNPSASFQEWLRHPTPDAYWQSLNPTPEQYARLRLPVLTITGCYDDDQPGALMHYRQHLQYLPGAQHYLIIGPWDHYGTRTPKQEFCGVKVGPASLVDLPRLHLDWYRWTLEGGPRPEFLQQRVAYYVMGAERWRYAGSLEEITSHSAPLYLSAKNNPVDVFKSGQLSSEGPTWSEPASYTYDPRDISLAELESTVDPESRGDQRMVYASVGKQLIYHGAPLPADIEIAGFFSLSVWLAIDQPDTDFRAAVYEVLLDGSSILLSSDVLRARYRTGLTAEELIRTTEPLRYDFQRFMFIARLLRKGHRLRLVIGPLNSIYWQKNYNSGGVVAEESPQDARPVRVRLYQDPEHPSVLHVPYAHG